MVRTISTKAEELIMAFGDAVFSEGMETYYPGGADNVHIRTSKEAQKKLEAYILELELAFEYATKR